MTKNLDGWIPDVCMADEQQQRLFEAVGPLRKPFAEFDRWPWLNESLRWASAEVLQREGYDKWRNLTGGTYDDQGQPSCRMDSRLATDMVRHLADNVAGLRWLDSSGEGWAVKLVTSVHGKTLLGFALSLGRSLQAGPGVAGAAYGEPQFVPTTPLSLGHRTEQLLWAIHAAVLTQRCSTIILPDQMLAQIFWGASRGGWPDNWRADLMRRLAALTRLHTEVWRIGQRGWQPQLGSASALLASATDNSVLRHDGDRCLPQCPMFHTGRPHSHFVVEIGTAFLGLLECYRSQAQPLSQPRTYDFGRDPADESLAKHLQEARRAGHIVPISLPAKLLSASKWAGLGSEYAAVMQAFTREVTRDRKSQRPDRAAVFTGSDVPGSRKGDRLRCPYLSAAGSWMTFGGNGTRPGQGYRVIGNYGGGWLQKCGYDVPADDAGRSSLVRQFLEQCERLQEVLGAVVVGFDPAARQFVGLVDLQGLARGQLGWKRVDRLHVRTYAPADYLARQRAYFERRGGFTTIPGDLGPATEDGDGAAQQPDIALRMCRAHVSQGTLAKALGKDRSYISRLVNGRKPWPPELRQRADDALRQLEEVGAAKA